MTAYGYEGGVYNTPKSSWFKFDAILVSMFGGEGGGSVHFVLPSTFLISFPFLPPPLSLPPIKLYTLQSHPSS
jgi:hypothetical protein